MTFKLVFLAVVALALLTLDLASAHGQRGCSPQRDDRDWVRHHYAVLEISTTDVVTPSDLFFGTAPLQNDVWANYLYDLDGTEVVGFDVGLCTMTPAINNTGSLYELCNIVHYFNNGADQVVLNGANNFNNQEEPQPYAVVGGVGAYNGASGSCTVQTDAVSLNAIYVCDFWTPNYASY